MPVPIWDSESMRWGSFYWDTWEENDVKGQPFRVHWSEFEGGSYSSVVSALAIQKDLGTAVDVSVVGGDGQSNVITLGSALSNTDLLLVLQGVRQ